MNDNIIIGYILEFVKDNKIWLIVTILVTLICNPIEMIVLSDLFTNFTTAINNLAYKESISILWKMTAVYIFIDVAYMLGNYFDKIYYPKLERFIRFKLIDVIFKHNEENYDKEDISNHIIKALKIPNTATSFTSIFVYWILTFILTTILIIGYICYVNLGIGMLTLAIFTVFFIFYYFMLIKTKATSSEREHEENELLLYIDDVLSNSLSIITTKKIDDEKEYLNTKHNVYDVSHEEHLWHNSKGGFLLSVIGSALLVVFVYILLTLYRKKQISSSDTIKLIIIILFFVKYVKTTSQQSMLVITEYGKLCENEANIQKLVVKNAGGSEIKDKSIDNKTDTTSITGNIEFRNVSFEYPKIMDEIKADAGVSAGAGARPSSSSKILDNVSFKIKSRDRVAIIGTNGSGKSTIIKLMCGFFKPTEGQILFDGVDIQNIGRAHLRSKISVVSQKVVLFNRSILDNICYGTNVPKEEAIKTLDRLKIMEVFKKLPQGLDTMAGSRGEKLSGGQRQIVYLLRSYLSNKPITIMDEPTAAVDAFHKNYVLQMINEMSKKTTLIIVTHDSEIASTFPMKIYLESGRIVKVNRTDPEGIRQNRTTETERTSRNFVFTYNNDDPDYYVR
jgi:ABC-type multidrug transport system fused ATPase/permease subunit